MILGATTTLPVATGIVNIWAATPWRRQRGPHPERGVPRPVPPRPRRQPRQPGRGRPRAPVTASPLARIREYLDFMKNRACGAPRGPRPAARRAGRPRPEDAGAGAAETAGAHPYSRPRSTPPWRGRSWPDRLLAPEQMSVLSTDAAEARGSPARPWGCTRPPPTTPTTPPPRLHRRGHGGRHQRPPRRRHRGLATPPPQGPVAEHDAAGADHVCVQVLTPTPARVRPGLARLAPALLD